MIGLASPLPCPLCAVIPFGAVGRLCDRRGEMTVTLFENVFSAVQLRCDLPPPCFESKSVNILDGPLIVP
jgi:hypothetical protein